MLQFPFSGQKIRAKAAALAVMAMTGMNGIGNASFGYAVSVNGKPVGTARDRYTIEQAITDSEELLKSTLGDGYTLETKITPTISAQAMDTAEIENGIIDSLPEISLQWTINVDGNVVGVMPSKEAGEELVKEIISRYTTEHTVSASTLQTVTYELKYVGQDVTRDERTIKRWLNPINENSPFRLQVLTVENEVKSHKIPHETEYIESYDYYNDVEFVEVEGSDGRETITSSVERLNGNEILRTVTDEVTDKAPVTEQIVKGMVERPVDRTKGYFIWPAQGVLTSTFGYRNIEIGSSNHKGIDIAGDYYDYVVAADGGEVVYADWMSGYGYLVIIQHDNGYETYYAHNAELNVYVGERVAQGEVIAFMGSTGNSTGVHCHFEVRIGGEAYNPLYYLP